MTQHVYSALLNENDPKYEQPNKITMLMKPHQLTALCKAITMEQEECILLNNNDKQFEIQSNMGIIGDKVGFGKTLTTLAIIAGSDLGKIHVNNTITKDYYYSGNRYGLGLIGVPLKVKYHKKYSTDLPNDIFVKTTLIVVPRGPVYNQWKKIIEEHTTLKYLYLDSLRTIKQKFSSFNDIEEVKSYFEEHDLVLIKNTTIKVLQEYIVDKFDYILDSFYRVVIDEAHVIKSPYLGRYKFIWFVTSSYEYCIDYNGYFYNNNLLFSLVKNSNDYIDKSFNIPDPDEKTYLCKSDVALSIACMYANENIRNKINVNDISGAIKDLGGTDETEESLVELIKDNYIRSIRNKNRELEYIRSLDLNDANQKETRIKNVKQELERLNNRLESLTNKISDILSTDCPVCLDKVKSPIYLKCSHVLCGNCLFKIVENKVKNTRSNNGSIVHTINCPVCREKCSSDALTAIVKSKTEEDEETRILSKEECMVKIIKNKPNGKFLLFTNQYNSFREICMEFCMHEIKYSEIKGNTGAMMNILKDFNNGDLQVILLNTSHAGSGIDISTATDVIIFNSMPKEKAQAIGRAQRVGRTEKLTIHNLYYSNEIENNFELEQEPSN